jgi:hypothetical protein
MIRIYYHIYTVRNCFDIVKKQLDLLKNSIEENFELNIIILTGKEQDKKSKNDSSVQIKNWLEKNDYKIRKFVDETEYRNEWVTLDCILEDKEKFNSDDFILYFHVKGVTHSLEDDPNKKINRDTLHRLNYERFTNNWKQIMEHYLIKNYKECISIFKNTEYNTIGTFLNEPMWNCFTYAGNMFWMKGDYAKTLGNFEKTLFNDETFDKKINSTAEFNFVNSGLNWNPYSVFNIPYDIFTDIEFINLLKNKK